MHAQFTSVALRTSTGRTVRAAAIASNATQGLLPANMGAIATNPDAPLCGWRRPSDGAHVTRETRTTPTPRPVRSTVTPSRYGSPLADRYVNAVLRSDAWTWTPIYPEQGMRAGAYVQTEVHLAAAERLQAGEITPEDVPAAYVVTNERCTCPFRGLCDCLVAFRHAFIKPNEIVVAAMAMAEAVARHALPAAPECEAAPAPASRQGKAVVA